MKKIIWYPHARVRLKERAIDIKNVHLAVNTPNQVIHKGRFRIFHKIYHDHRRNKDYMLRVFAEEYEGEVIVHSLYRTSKIAKYWRK